MVIYPGRRIPENIILKTIEKREYIRIHQPFWLCGAAGREEGGDGSAHEQLASLHSSISTSDMHMRPPLMKMEHAWTCSSATHASGDACACVFAHCFRGLVANSSWPSGGPRFRGWEPLEYNIVSNVLFRSVFSSLMFSTYMELKLLPVILKMTNGVSV